MRELPPAWLACLREASEGPMTLQMRFEGDGERRGRPMWGRLGGEWHEVVVVVALARAGLIEGKDDSCAILRPTARGQAMLAETRVSSA